MIIHTMNHKNSDIIIINQKFIIMIKSNQMKDKQILAVLFYYIYQLTHALDTDHRGSQGSL
jgi:hypothetical protein